MFATKAPLIIGVILIIAGILALAYGGFTYTKDSETTSLGPIEFTVSDKETVAIPIWVGIGAVVCGAGFLLAPPLLRGT